MELDVSIGHQLPGIASSRIIGRTREWIVADIPSADTKPRPTCTRSAIYVDPQADTRIFGVVAALHYMAFKYRVNLIGIAKMPGARLCWWYGDAETEPYARRPFIEAVNAAIGFGDHWSLDIPGIIVPMHEGVLVRDDLVSDDLLRSVPERYRLGLVTP